MSLRYSVVPDPGGLGWFQRGWKGHMNPYLTSKTIETKIGDTCVRNLVKRSLEAARQVERIIDEMEENLGYEEFFKIWPYIRAQMSLQFRLIAEQIFWDRGGQWRRLVSGFKAVTTTGSNAVTGSSVEKDPRDIISPPAAAKDLAARQGLTAEQLVLKRKTFWRKGR